MAEVTISADQVREALRRAAAALRERSDYLTELDQAMGDGDLGITARKIAGALEDYASTAGGEDESGREEQSSTPARPSCCAMHANLRGPDPRGGPPSRFSPRSIAEFNTELRAE